MRFSGVHADEGGAGGSGKGQVLVLKSCCCFSQKGDSPAARESIPVPFLCLSVGFGCEATSSSGMGGA